MSIQTVFGLLITTLFIIAGFCFKRRKITSKIQLIWIWILSAFSTGGGDWKSHIDIFQRASTDNIFSINDGGLYNLICYIFKNAGMDFIVMNFVISTITCIIIYKITVTLSKYPSICLSLYMIYPLVDSIIQKRFYFSSIIVLCGMKYLYAEKKSYIKYIATCLLAGLIHVAAYAYIFYALVYWIMNVFKSKKWMWGMLIAAYCMIPAVPKLAEIIFPDSKINLYFYVLRLTMIDALFWTMFHLGFFILNTFVYYYMKEINKDTPEIYKRANNLQKINVSSLIYIPLYYFEPTFIRYFRNTLIFNWASFTYIFPSHSKVNRRLFVLIIFIILFQIFAFFIVYAVTGTGLKNLVYPIFENNLIFSLMFS